MKSKRPSRKPIGAGWLLLVLLALAVLLLCAMLHAAFSPKLVEPQPVTLTATSPRGATLHLHHHLRASNIEVDARKMISRSPFWNMNMGSSRSKHGIGLSYSGHTDMGPLVYTLGTATPDQKALMIRCTVLDSSQQPLTGNLGFSHEGKVLQWSIENHQVKIDYAPRGLSPKVRLEMATRSREGSNVWLRAAGPFHFGEREGTVFSFRHADWHQQTFDLRAVFEDGEVIPFTIKNPISPVLQPESWTSSPKPWVVETDEFKFTLDKVVWRSDWHDMVTYHGFKVKPGGGQDRSSFKASNLLITDDISNRRPSFLFPSVQNLRVTGEINLRRFYKFAAEDCTAIATFSWPSATEKETMTPATGAPPTIKSMEVGRSAARDQSELTFTIHASQATLFESYHLAVLPLNAPRSFGEPGAISSSTRAGDTKYEVELYLSNEKDRPAPGDVVELVIIPKITFPFDFIIPAEDVAIE